MDVVQQALNSDPDYQAAKFQNAADAEATVQAWSRFLPHLHAEANYASQNQDIISSDNTVYAVGNTHYPDYGYAVTMDLSLFNYSDWANLKAARALTRQSNAQFESAKQDLLLRVAERYFTVLVAAETANAARAESRALKEHVGLVQGKVNGGAARQAELLDAQAHYLQSQARQAKADAAVRDAVEGLRAITGVTVADFNGLSDKLTIKPLDPADTQHWVDMARHNNPRIKAAVEATERGHQEVEAERSRWYPNVSLQVFQNRHKTEGSLFGGGSDIGELGGMVKVYVPIYEGGDSSSRVRQADALYNKARVGEDKTGRDVVRETAAAVDGIKTAQSQAGALRASLKAQEQVVEQLTESYRSGAASNVDVLDAQRDLFLARAQYVRARYNYALDTLKLRHAVGLLDISDLEEVNRLMVGNPVDVAAFGVVADAAPPGHPAAPSQAPNPSQASDHSADTKDAPAAPSQAPDPSQVSDHSADTKSALAAPGLRTSEDVSTDAPIHLHPPKAMAVADDEVIHLHPPGIANRSQLMPQATPQEAPKIQTADAGPDAGR
jgi:outer membrane protein